MKTVPLGGTGIQVSEFCLGTMTFGDSWALGTSADNAAGIYAAYRAAGGNFVDTANLYTSGESETILGGLIASERDEIVLSTKFGLQFESDVNSGGAGRKSLCRSVESSLRRLGTDYIDLLWSHIWDRTVPLEETLRALDDLIASGKVLSVGVSNTPAWVISQANAIAAIRGRTTFSAIQVEYSLAERTAERELIPMARTHDMLISAWSPLGRGLLVGKRDPERLDATQRRIVESVAKVAAELGSTPARVALAWTRQRGVMPVLGATSVAQIQDNLGALDLELGDEHICELNAASAVSLGYPYDFLAGAEARRRQPREPMARG